MEITDIRVRKIDNEGKMKAVVSVTFDDSFVIHDIKVIESQNGLFIAMPSRKTPSGEFRDIAHPVFRNQREDSICHIREIRIRSNGCHHRRRSINRQIKSKKY